MKTPRKDRRTDGGRSERGVAMVIALIVLVALSFAGVSILSSSAGTNRASTAEAVASQSVECAVGGANWGIGKLSSKLYEGAPRNTLLGTSLPQSTLGTGAIQGTVNVSFMDNDDGDGNLSVDADGRIYSSAACSVMNSLARVEMLGAPFMGSAFAGGVCGCLSVDLGASTTTDSFNSLTGSYGGAEGNIVSNLDVDVHGATVNGSVFAARNIHGPGQILGDAWAGTAIDVESGNFHVAGVRHPGQAPPASCRCSGATQINGDPTIDDGTAAARAVNKNIPPPNTLPSPCNINPRLYDSPPFASGPAGATAYLDALLAIGIPAEPGNTCLSKYYPRHLKVGLNYECSPGIQCCTTVSNSPFDTYEIGGVEYRYKFDNGGHAECAFTTGTYYFVEFKTSGTSAVVIDTGLNPGDFQSTPNDNVILYWDEKSSGASNNDYTLRGTSLSNAPALSLNLEIYSKTTYQIELKGTTAFAGVLYAPYATAILTGTSTIYGALFGKLVDVNGTPDIHYEVNLLNRNDFDQGFSPLAGTWRVRRDG